MVSHGSRSALSTIVVGLLADVCLCARLRRGQFSQRLCCPSSLREKLALAGVAVRIVLPGHRGPRQCALARVSVAARQVSKMWSWLLGTVFFDRAVHWAFVPGAVLGRDVCQHAPIPTCIEPFWSISPDFVGLLPLFLHHATLVSFLLVTSLCDLRDMEMPLPITVTGTLVGLGFAVLLSLALSRADSGTDATRADMANRCVSAVPGHLPLAGVVSAAGLAAAGELATRSGHGTRRAPDGMMVLRGVRFCLAWDGDRRARPGRCGPDDDGRAFVGWQPVMLAFFVAVFPALFLGVMQLGRARGSSVTVRSIPGPGRGAHPPGLAQPGRPVSAAVLCSRVLLTLGGIGTLLSLHYGVHAAMIRGCQLLEIAPMQNIVIVDYGMANLRSVQKAFEKVGSRPTSAAIRTGWPRPTRWSCRASGAFRDAIARLHEAAWWSRCWHICTPASRSSASAWACKCCSRSHEDGESTRPRIISPARWFASRTCPASRCPHMGWNQLTVKRLAPPVAGLKGRRSISSIPIIVVPADQASSRPRPTMPTPSRPRCGRTMSSPRSFIRRKASGRFGNASPLRHVVILRSAASFAAFVFSFVVFACFFITSFQVLRRTDTVMPSTLEEMLLSAIHADSVRCHSMVGAGRSSGGAGRRTPEAVSPELASSTEASGRDARLRRLSRSAALLAAGVEPFWPSILNSIGMKLVLVPPGKFLMGSPTK